MGGDQVEIVAPLRRGKGVKDERRTATRYGRGETFGLPDRVALDERLEGMGEAAGRRARRRRAKAFDQHWFEDRNEARALAGAPPSRRAAGSASP